MDAKRYLPPLLLAVLLAAVAIRFGDLRRPGLSTGDEALTALRVLGLMEHGHGWTPYWNGEPDEHKPPFYFWFVAIGYQLLGVGELAIRLPSVIFFLLLSVLVYRIGRRVFDPWTGLLAVAFLCLHPSFVTHARLGMHDMALIFLFWASAWCLLRASESPRHYLAWGACCGLAVLTKSYAGLPALAASGLYLIALRRSAFRSPHFYAGLGLAIALPAVWFVWQYFQQANRVAATLYGDMFHYRLKHDWTDWRVYAVSLRHLWFSWGALAPFFVAAPLLLWLADRGRPASQRASREVLLVYLLAILPLLAACSVRQQMPWYMLPVVVPMALLGARLARLLLGGHGAASLRLLCCALLVAGIFLPGVCPGGHSFHLWICLAAALAALLGFGGPRLRRLGGAAFAAGLILAVMGGMSPRNRTVNRIQLKDPAYFIQIASLLPSREEAPGPILMNFRHYPSNTIMFYARRDSEQLARVACNPLRPGERRVAVVKGEDYGRWLPVAQVRKLHTVGDMSILVLEGPERNPAPKE